MTVWFLRSFCHQCIVNLIHCTIAWCKTFKLFQDTSKKPRQENNNYNWRANICCGSRWFRKDLWLGKRSLWHCWKDETYSFRHNYGCEGSALVYVDCLLCKTVKKNSKYTPFGWWGLLPFMFEECWSNMYL